MTGQYDRKAEAQALTDANTDRLARDPFSTVPGAEHQRPGNQATERPAALRPSCGDPGCDVTCAVNGCNPTCPCQPPAAEAPAPEAEAPAGPDLFRADWPYPQLSAAQFSALYAEAADTIEARGYYAYEVQGYDGDPGISITGALKAAALGHAQAADPADTADQHYRAAADLTEELETRLSAVLYVFGQVHTRTGIRDLSDIHVGWSLGHFDLGPNPDAAAAVTLLRQAARIFASL